LWFWHIFFKNVLCIICTRFFFGLQNRTNLSPKNHSLDQSHYRGLGFNNPQRGGFGNPKKIHTMPHEKTLWNSTLSNGMMQRNNNTILVFVLPTHFVFTKIENPLTLKLEMWDGPRPFLPYSKIIWLRKYINCE